MKNEITPQIAALYIGQMATITWLVDGDYFERGEEWNTDIKHSVLEWFVSGKATIRPHLRPLSSLTEAEARELYEISRGGEWDYEYNSYAANRDRGMGKIWSCLENWWMGNYEMFGRKGNWLVGDPNAWLYLLSKGFDLFQGIEAGWAKEVK